MARAVFNGVVIAESDQTIEIEGVTFFPPDSLREGVLAPTTTRTACPWRGIATYFTVTVDGRSEADAAYGYLSPKKRGARLKGYIGFWKSVVVETDD